MPTVKEGHVDQLLSNMSVAFIQSANLFIVAKVFPLVPVENASDFYLEFPRGYFFRDQVGKRPIGGYSPVADFKVEKKPYLCEEEGLTSFLDDRERNNATPPYDPERAKTVFLTQQHLIHRDRTWADKYFKTGAWTNEKTGVAAAPGANQFIQFDQAASDPINVIKTYVTEIAELTGFKPNKMTVGAKADLIISEHADVVDRVKYVGKSVTPESLAGLFGVEDYLVPMGVHNKAAEGATDSFEFIVGKKDILICYAAPNPGIEVPSAGYTFSWRGLLGAAGYESAIWRGRDERAHSDWFECRMAYDQRQIAPDLAIFLKDAVG